MNLNHCCDDKCISTVSPLGIEHNDKDNVEMDGIQGGGREETDEEAARTTKFLKSLKASEKVSGSRQGAREGEKVSESRQ